MKRMGSIILLVQIFFLHDLHACGGGHYHVHRTKKSVKPQSVAQEKPLQQSNETSNTQVTIAALMQTQQAQAAEIQRLQTLVASLTQAAAAQQAPPAYDAVVLPITK